MRTPRRRRPTDDDLARLQNALRILRDLMSALHPATPEYRSAEAAYDAVRTCAIDWTGNPDIWSSRDLVRGKHSAVEGFVRRPDHEPWPRR